MKNTPTKIFFIIGARPNYMKLAPLWRYYKQMNLPVQMEIVHSNQHTDPAMNDTLLRQLGMDKIHHHLEVKDNWSIGKAMDAFHLLFSTHKPDWVIVVGDVHTTIAASLIAKYNKIKVAHIEAGLRSNDREMPEEINRLATDAIADIFFTTMQEGREQLIKEGVAEAKIFNIGNLMIDTLLYHYKNDNNVSKDVALVTLHRPSNVDDPVQLKKILDILINVSKDIPIIFPLHHRTKSNLEKFGLNELLETATNIQITPPNDYFEMIKIYQRCKFILTDSGGIQEESTALSIPCLTLRENTERPVTVSIGTNTIIGKDTQKLQTFILQILQNKYKKGQIPPLWDGFSAQRFWKMFISIKDFS